MPSDAPTRPQHAPSATRLWLGVLALAVLGFVGSWFALSLARFGGVAAVWVANGLLTGALLLTPRPTWRWFFLAGALGQAAARWLVGDAWPWVLGLTLANVVECAIVAFWVRRHVADLHFAPSLRRVAGDSFASSFAACAISATLALPILLHGGAPSAAVAWGTWFTAHLLGMVFVATLTVCAFQRGIYLLGRPGRRFDFALCLGLLLLVCALAFGQERYSLLFLVFLPLLLLSWRHGLGGMVLGTLVVATISGITAVEGRGSFAIVQDAAPLARLYYWQVYIAAACLLAYSTAVAITQRQRAQQAQAAIQAQLRAITEYLPAMVARFDRDVRYVYANSRSRAMVPGVELVGKTLRELRGDKRYAELLPQIEGALRGEAQQFDTWLDTKDGRVELRAQFVPDIAADGSVQGFYSVSFDISEAKRLERELEQQARFDPLTGLANRLNFDDAMEHAVARAQRTGAALLVLALDLDRFKQINDTLGHAAGDEVLKEFGRRVKASVYDVDLVARLGGDEFVVLVEYSATEDSGKRIAEAIIEAMRPPIDLPDGATVQAATSIGIGLQQPVVSAESLLALADKALYEAKGRGRNTYALFRSDSG